MVTEVRATLRAQGKRLTAQRRRVLAALAHLGHATPERVAAHLGSDGGPVVSVSTVYRSLHALSELGVVTHTHLDHGPPTYQLADHGDHVHLVCTGCGALDELPVTAAAGLVGAAAQQRGFRADVAHLAVHGWCGACAAPEQAR